MMVDGSSPPSNSNALEKPGGMKTANHITTAVGLTPTPHPVIGP
jgi:hypothetical protein